MPSGMERWTQLYERNLEQSWSRTYDIPDAGDLDWGVLGSVHSMCGGPDLAHLCEPSGLRTVSHVGADGGLYTTSVAHGTSSVKGGRHGL